jgi:glucosamine-6-phosphate deaminase
MFLYRNSIVPPTIPVRDNIQVPFRVLTLPEKIRTVDRYQLFSEEIAEIVAAQLQSKPDSALGLPTGNSPLGCYRLLSKWSQEGNVDWSQARCFALDDYLDSDEQITFQHFLETNLYQFTNLKNENKFNPRLVDNYDLLIEQSGGLDLTLLGIGTNGHIAFNEPGTPLESWTHTVLLTESTRRANQSYFSQTTSVPYTAITMGIRTILASKKLILIVSGENKRDILERALLEEINPNIPASYLSLHPHVTVMTDFDLET